MRVNRVVMHNFMVHDDFHVDLPKSGLVVLLGPNGSGKSAVIEAVANALWNKSLRNETAWRKDQGGSVSVVANGDLNAERKVNKRGAKTFQWKIVGEDKKTYDTPTKAQQALLDEIGTFDQWRCTHVFSSQDVSHFSMATDGERKALIEELLGLSVFDSAWELCNADLKDAKHDLANASLAKDRAKLQFEAAKEAYDAASQYDDPRPVEPAQNTAQPRTPPEMQKEAARQGLVERRAKSFQVPTFITDSVAVANAQLSDARNKVVQVKEGVCPTCDQVVSDDLLGAFENDVRLAANTVESVNKRLESTQNECAVDRETNQSDIKLLQQQLEQADAMIRDRELHTREHDRYVLELDGWKKRKNQAAEKRIAASDKWAVAEEALSDAEDKEALHKEEAEYLSAARDVLGLRGARVRVLAEALEGIEAVANVWMVKFFDSEAYLRLNPTSELKSGKTVATIGLEVYGVGGGVGYKGLSGGERRRVDVALIMALAEVQAAAAGKERGTLFMDEVFDSLDEKGRSAVQHEVRELAKERAVVLITHVADLAAGLDADLLVRFDGKAA